MFLGSLFNESFLFGIDMRGYVNKMTKFLWKYINKCGITQKDRVKFIKNRKNN